MSRPKMTAQEQAYKLPYPLFDLTVKEYELLQVLLKEYPLQQHLQYLCWAIMLYSGNCTLVCKIQDAIKNCLTLGVFFQEHLNINYVSSSDMIKLYRIIWVRKLLCHNYERIRRLRKQEHQTRRNAARLAADKLRKTIGV